MQKKTAIRERNKAQTEHKTGGKIIGSVGKNRASCNDLGSSHISPYRASYANQPSSAIFRFAHDSGRSAAESKPRAISLALADSDRVSWV